MPQNANQDGFFGKVNYDLRNGWRISGRYARANPVSTGPQFTLGSPIDLATDRRLFWSAIGEVVGVLTPSQVLEIRGGWTHTGQTQPPRGWCWRSLSLDWRERYPRHHGQLDWHGPQWC